MEKIYVTFMVDKETLLKESGQSSLEEAISQEMGWLHDSGIFLDSWSFDAPQVDWASRCLQMIKEELETNGAVYGLSNFEINGMAKDDTVLSTLVNRMQSFMHHDGCHEYDALEKMFQSELFQTAVQEYRADRLECLVPGLKCPIDDLGYFSGVALAGIGHFFVSDSQGLCVELENQKDAGTCRQVLQTISALDPGDAFFVSYNDKSVELCITPDGSHQNLDEPDEPWIVYDFVDNCWFEEDINREVPDMLERFLRGIEEKQKNKEKLSLHDRIQDAAGRAGEEEHSTTEKSHER